MKSSSTVLLAICASTVLVLMTVELADGKGACAAHEHKVVPEEGKECHSEGAVCEGKSRKAKSDAAPVQGKCVTKTHSKKSAAAHGHHHHPTLVCCAPRSGGSSS